MLIHPAIIDKLNRERQKQQWQPLPLQIERPVEWQRPEQDDEEHTSFGNVIEIQL